MSFTKNDCPRLDAVSKQTKPFETSKSAERLCCLKKILRFFFLLTNTSLPKVENVVSVLELEEQRKRNDHASDRFSQRAKTLKNGVIPLACHEWGYRRQVEWIYKIQIVREVIEHIGS